MKYDCRQHMQRLNVHALWDSTSCRLINSYHRFKGIRLHPDRCDNLKFRVYNFYNKTLQYGQR